MIKIDHITKDYGHGKGIFDISLQLHKGEVYGYLGSKGSGKTTIIRHLMGFIKPEIGSAYIRNKNCWSKANDIHQMVGYLPGKLSFPSDMTGNAYIQMMMKLRHMKSTKRMDELISLFELDMNTVLKNMSKEAQQKIGIVTAFMHEPLLLILDEPMSSLDPLMQNRFVELIEQEKKKGTTILMSSHMFEDVERTCTRIGIIRDGRVIEEKTAQEIIQSRMRAYEIAFFSEEEFDLICALQFKKTNISKTYLRLVIHIDDAHINVLLRSLSQIRLKYLKEDNYNVEDYVMQFYRGETYD